MFDLKYASINIRKAAKLKGFRSDRHNAYYIPVTGHGRGVMAVVGDDGVREVEITRQDMEYAAQFTWAEL